MAVFQGTGVTRGIAIGPAWLYRPIVLPVVPRQAEAVALEMARFEEALAWARRNVQALRAALAPELWPLADRLLEAQDLLLLDPALVERTRGAILEGRPAEAAWQRAVESYLAIFSPIRDEGLRSRAAALGDVGRQVMAALLGAAEPTLAAGAEAVVLAAHLSPTEFLRLAAWPPLGLCLAGSRLLAPAIALARCLDLPTVTGLGEEVLAQVPAGTMVVVDGATGVLRVAPDDEALAYSRDRQRLLRAAAPPLDLAEPAHTADGWRVDVRVDLERPDDLPLALARGAEGIGLARTDYVFVGRQRLPGEEEQAAAYREFLDLAHGRVTFCTLMVGSEEALPWPAESETAANPLMGLRGVRLSLAYLSAFREQLRAILRAGAGRPIGVALPMAETLSELRAAQEWLRRAQQDLHNAGIPYSCDVPVALIVQTPLALMNLEPLLAEVATVFLDLDRLTEYLSACDRQNRRVAHLFHPLHPVGLRLIQEAVQTVHRQGKRVEMCGECAGAPAAVALLLGLEVDGFCLPVERISTAKSLLRRLTVPAAKKLAEEVLRLPGAAEAESMVEDFLEQQEER